MHNAKNKDHILLSKEASLDSARQAKKRLRWMEYYQRFRSARLTCRHFGISPSTFYLWLSRYTPADSASLVDTRTRRPKRLRKPTWQYKTLLLLERYMETHPLSRLSHIQSFLQSQGLYVSISTVSRMLKRLQNVSKTL